MKIEKAYPPNFGEIQQKLHPDIPNTVFAYGDTIYNPSGNFIPPDVEAHEEVHQRQQGQYPEVWWTRYLSDVQFRYDQEVEAYHTQYLWWKKNFGSNAAKEALEVLATDFSELYDLPLTFHQAHTAIRKYKKSNK